MANLDIVTSSPCRFDSRGTDETSESVVVNRVLLGKCCPESVDGLLVGIGETIRIDESLKCALV